MGNYTDDEGIIYSYTLESDNLRYIRWQSVTDFSSFQDVSYWTAYTSIIFGVLVLIHSSIINKKRLNSVRLASDLSACFSIVYGALFLISAYRPNKTKTAIAWDLLSYGLCTCGIQLCDAYLFINRYRAVAKVSNLERWTTHAYISFVIVLPYYSTLTFLPLFIDMNEEASVNLETTLLEINSLGTIIYNLYFTALFSYLADSFTRKVKSRLLKWIIIKSLFHCVTSSIANILVDTSAIFNTFYFDSNMYNIMIVFGIHFLFNYKIESSIHVRRFVGNYITVRDLHHTILRKVSKCHPIPVFSPEREDRSNSEI